MGLRRVTPLIVSHSVIATNVGNTVIWTPAAGLRFVLLSVVVVYSGTNAAAPLISLNDSGSFLTYVLAPPTAQYSAAFTFDIPGGGYVSAADNNVLNVNLSGASGVAVTVWGYEV
jgi:hypothetical protein